MKVNDMRLALPFALALATQAGAQTMTDAQRADFRAEVRAYLLENPEVIMEAVEILQAREQQAAAVADAQLATTYADELFNDPDSFVGGNPDGDITIVEFMDYRCGYCKRAFPEVASLVAGDGNIRYIVKEFPILGEASMMASQFAVAVKLTAGDDAYHDVHNTLMEFRGDITEQTLVRLSESFGLDTEATFAAMNGPDVAEIIGRNRTLGRYMNITGTPTFVVQTELIRGYIPFDQMAQIVAEIRG